MTAAPFAVDVPFPKMDTLPLPLMLLAMVVASDRWSSKVLLLIATLLALLILPVVPLVPIRKVPELIVVVEA